MLTACWSVKGGAGVSVVAASLALRVAAHRPCLLVDLGGDQPDIAGVPAPSGPGVSEWLARPHDPPPLADLAVSLPGGVALLPRGVGPLEASRAGALLTALGALDRSVVVDCGAPAGADHGAPGELTLAIAGAATQSLLVTRPCLLALKRAVKAPVRPSGVVVVLEAGRALRTEDVAEVLGVPVVAEVAVDPTVARAVDAGLLAHRLPRPLQRGLRHVA